MPEKLNVKNNSKWKAYYKDKIIHSIHSSSYKWIVEELENLGNNNAELALNIARTTNIGLVELLLIIINERTLEDLGEDFSNDKYDIYLKQFGKAKEKLSKLAGYVVDVYPITKPIHSIYILYSRHHLDVYQEEAIKTLFNRKLIKASKNVITNYEKWEDEEWQKILLEYPHLKDLPKY